MFDILITLLPALYSDQNLTPTSLYLLLHTTTKWLY